MTPLSLLPAEGRTLGSAQQQQAADSAATFSQLNTLAVTVVAYADWLVRQQDPVGVVPDLNYSCIGDWPVSERQLLLDDPATAAVLVRSAVWAYWRAWGAWPDWHAVVSRLRTEIGLSLGEAETCVRVARWAPGACIWRFDTYTRDCSDWRYVLAFPAMCLEEQWYRAGTVDAARMIRELSAQFGGVPALVEKW